MGEVEVMVERDEGEAAEWQRATRPAALPVDPEQLLGEELSRIRGDRALVTQIVRLIQLSRDLRIRSYTGQVTLHVGNGLVNSVRQEVWLDWRSQQTERGIETGESTAA